MARYCDNYLSNKIVKLNRIEPDILTSELKCEAFLALIGAYY